MCERFTNAAQSGSVLGLGDAGIHVAGYGKLGRHRSACNRARKLNASLQARGELQTHFSFRLPLVCVAVHSRTLTRRLSCHLG